MNNKITFGIVGIIAGVIITLALGSGGGYESMMWGGNYSNNHPTSSRTFGMMNQIDQHFIEQMIPHHDGAIAMANLALIKATRPEIKSLAREIIEAQNQEIVDMQSWYKNWFGNDVPEGGVVMMGGMMSLGGMHTSGEAEIQALENAVDFDKAFIESMIPHHQLAIMMAQMLKAGTDRPEMQQLAKNILESQSQEITKMQGWYANWYK